MAPPKWKLLVELDPDSQFCSRSFNSAQVCPCRYCWSKGCRGRTNILRVSDLYSISGFNCSRPSSKEPAAKWKLLLIFDDGSELSSRLQKCEICPCSYCWCGLHGTAQFQHSDFRALQKFLPTKVADSLEELFRSRNPSDKTVIKMEAEINQVGAKPREAKVKNQDVEKESSKDKDTPSLDSKASISIQESPIRRSVRISRKKASQDPSQSPKSDNKLLAEVKSETPSQPEDPEVKDTVSHNDSQIEVPKELPPSDITSSTVDAVDEEKPEVKPKKQSHTTDHRTHVKKHSQGFNCYECHKRFQRKSALNQHLQEHNSHPFECYLCPLRFKTSKENIAHVRTHSSKRGERPFQCNQCEKSFNHRHHLKAHMLHHTGERPFKCNQCSLTFTHSGSLSNHKARHRNVPFTCDLCSESFVHQKHLRDHKRIHSDEKPHLKGQESKLQLKL